MKATVEAIREIVKVLTPEEQQLLKDTFLFGGWGDTETEFLNEEGKTETVGAWGYCTNDAREGKHFAGRVVATMFRSIYRKLCTANRNQIGAHLSHCNDWWGDGNGDMLFVRSAWNKAWVEWAKEPLQPAEKPKSEDKPTIVKPKEWLFQFTTGRGEYLGRVTISSAKMPTTQEAVEEFAKVAPSAAKFVGKNGAEIITDKEQRLGDVPVGSTVYSNISGGNLKVVKHRRDYVVVLHLDGLKANLYSHIDSQYPVVVKKLGDSKAPAKKIPGNNGFQVSFAEDRDGVEMTVKKSQGANGIAVTYTRDQLRQLSDAINTYLAK
jgi:hypothetical protein